MLARDRFFPRQFVNLGDRLVYSNGIVVLAGLAALLIWVFDANVIALIHLYVIGVFTAFTLSQAGMVRYWLRRERAAAGAARAVVNGIGARRDRARRRCSSSRRSSPQGAWAVIVAIPLLVARLLRRSDRHYRKVARRLRAGVAAVAAAPPATNDVVLYVESSDAALDEAVWYARQIAGDDFHAIHVPGRARDPGIRPRFRELTDIRPDLEILHAGGRPRRGGDRLRLGAPARRVELRHRRRPGALPRASLARRAQPAPEFSAEAAPAPRAGRRDHRRAAARAGDGALALPDARCAASSSPAGTRRRCARRNTRRRSAFADTKALFFAFDDDEAERIRAEWARQRRCRSRSRSSEAPFRDLGDPLLRYLREITADPRRSRS